MQNFTNRKTGNIAKPISLVILSKELHAKHPLKLKSSKKNV